MLFRGELLDIVDEFQISSTVSEVARSVVRGRVKLEGGAGRLMAMLEGGGELGRGLEQLLLLRCRRWSWAAARER